MSHIGRVDNAVAASLYEALFRFSVGARRGSLTGPFAGPQFPADRLNYFCQRAAKTQPPEAEQLLLSFNL
jgi:hypothetical protein